MSVIPPDLFPRGFLIDIIMHISFPHVLHF